MKHVDTFLSKIYVIKVAKYEWNTESAIFSCWYKCFHPECTFAGKVFLIYKCNIDIIYLFFYMSLVALLTIIRLCIRHNLIIEIYRKFKKNFTKFYEIPWKIHKIDAVFLYIYVEHLSIEVLIIFPKIWMSYNFVILYN